jgi:adenosylcobinamide-GDP ribazoletransferase
MTLACRRGVPAARPDGLGAAVAGVLGPRTAWAAAVVVVLACAAAGPHAALAAVAALACAELLLHRCRARFGGVTGDVFGALSELAATTALVVLALG